MLMVMISSRSRALVAGLAVAALAAACTSTTSGDGHTSANPQSSLAPLPSFPSVPATLPTLPTASVSAPAASGSGAPSGTVSGSGSAPASASATTSPVPAEPLRTVTAHSDRGDYVIQIWAEVRTSTCADHAYGQPMINFLTAHPCSGLDRVLGTTTVDGRAVGFAESTLGFVGDYPAVSRVATKFQDLVRRDGTGNLNDLFRDGYRLPSGPTSVPSPDAFNVLGQDAGVSVFDVWYLNGPTRHNDRPLVHMTQDIFLQF